MSQILRPYQVQADKAVREAFLRGSKAVLLQLPCGAGKGTLAAKWMQGIRAKGNRAIFMVHRRELTRQARERLHENGVPHGAIEAGIKPEPWHQIQVASTQSLMPRVFPKDPATAAKPPEADFLIVDEAHRAVSRQTLKLINHFKSKGAKILGLSASPTRLDGRPLNVLFDTLVEVVSVRELIDLGYLSDYVIYEPPTRVSADGLKVNANGEFDDAEAAKIVDTDALVGEVYTNWVRRAKGKQTIIFAQTEAHGRHITKVFRDKGEDFWYVDYRTPRDERDRITDWFKAGKIMGIVNLSIYGEGFDVAACECVVIDRFIHSKVNWIQFTSRALRPRPGKVAIILDHGFNARDRFGGPDFPHEWSLDGTKRSEQPVQPVLTTCPVCRAIVSSRTRICPECNHVLHAVAPRQGIPDTVDGILVEGNYKIKYSDVEARKAERVAEALAAEKRRQEREARRREKAASELRKKQELEEQRRALTDLVAEASARNYSWRYPVTKFRDRFGFWPNSKHGVHIEWKKIWEPGPDGKMKLKAQMAWWEWDGVRYGGNDAKK